MRCGLALCDRKIKEPGGKPGSGAILQGSLVPEPASKCPEQPLYPRLQYVSKLRLDQGIGLTLYPFQHLQDGSEGFLVVPIWLRYPLLDQELLLLVRAPGCSSTAGAISLSDTRILHFCVLFVYYLW